VSVVLTKEVFEKDVEKIIELPLPLFYPPWKSPLEEKAVHQMRITSCSQKERLWIEVFKTKHGKEEEPDVFLLLQIV
jgi:hypothetical protein